MDEKRPQSSDDMLREVQEWLSGGPAEAGEDLEAKPPVGDRTSEPPAGAEAEVEGGR